MTVFKHYKRVYTILGLVIILIILLVTVFIMNRTSGSTSGSKSGSTSNPSIDEKCHDGVCYPLISSLPTETFLLGNNTSEDFLHVFVQIQGTVEIKKHGGNGEIHKPVDWSHHAWDPIGAKVMAEAIIPKNEYIIMDLPPAPPKVAFQFIAIKMRDSKNNIPLALKDAIKSKSGNVPAQVIKQWPILLEGGKDMVADSSAVDGINFRMTYGLTTIDGYKEMKINKNPCERLDKKFHMDVGCINPVRHICGNSSTVTCCPDDNNDDECIPKSQDCKFNDCTRNLFEIPTNLSKYINNYDGGKNNSPPGPVKKYVNDEKNIKKDTPLSKFCEDIHYNHGDFTPYCYDYNDTTSSVILATPYNIKIIYSDL
jgi:hypothetical protein